jgi:hypothetical protein
VIDRVERDLRLRAALTAMGETTKLRHGEVWVNCGAAREIYDQLKKNDRRFREIKDRLEGAGFGPGHLSRIRGLRASKTPDATRRMQRTNVKTFAEACGVAMASLIVDQPEDKDIIETRHCDVNIGKALSREQFERDWRARCAFRCLIVRYGADDYLATIASVEERSISNQMREIPVQIEFDPSDDIHLKFDIDVHVKLGTTFKCFVIFQADADEPRNARTRDDLIRILGQARNIGSVYPSSLAEPNVLWILFDDSCFESLPESRGATSNAKRTIVNNYAPPTRRKF